MKFLNKLKEAAELIGTLYSIVNAFVLALSFAVTALLTSSPTLQWTLIASVVISAVITIYNVPFIIKNAGDYTRRKKIATLKTLWCIIWLTIFLSMIAVLRPTIAEMHPSLIFVHSFLHRLFPITNILFALLMGAFIHNVILAVSLRSPEIEEKNK